MDDDDANFLHTGPHRADRTGGGMRCERDKKWRVFNERLEKLTPYFGQIVPCLSTPVKPLTKSSFYGIFFRSIWIRWTWRGDVHRSEHGYRCILTTMLRRSRCKLAPYEISWSWTEPPLVSSPLHLSDASNAFETSRPEKSGRDATLVSVRRHNLARASGSFVQKNAVRSVRG